MSGVLGPFDAWKVQALYSLESFWEPLIDIVSYPRRPESSKHTQVVDILYALKFLVTS
jgi:hypothetical protein